MSSVRRAGAERLRCKDRGDGQFVMSYSALSSDPVSFCQVSMTAAIGNGKGHWDVLFAVEPSVPYGAADSIARCSSADSIQMQLKCWPSSIHWSSRMLPLSLHGCAALGCARVAWWATLCK